MNYPFQPDSPSPDISDLLRMLSSNSPSFPYGLSALYSPPALNVHDRFSKLLSNLQLTPEQKQDGTTKANGVYQCLNSHYYGTNSNKNGFYVGSWGKETAVRPPRDVDVMFVLPNEVYWRFEGNYGNKQSQILQEIKGVLLKTYPYTDIRGDGQVVMVPFGSYNVELVPAFRLQNGQFWICNTNDGGSYKLSDPAAEEKAINLSNSATNGNTRDLIKMLKRWQEYCNVPIKSFVLELLAVEFLNSWAYRGKGYFYYDWMLRDFLRFLCVKSVYYPVVVPGTGEIIWLGGDWISRAQSALARANKACEYESAKSNQQAAEEWQKVFGSFIPVT
jgi:hypothetical protein